MPSSPLIILVRPQMGENIGATARAMLNFGLDQLRIVAPRDGWPNEKALETARGAAEVIERAVIYPTVHAAVADCQLAFATTVRPREMVKPVVTPRYAASALRQAAADGQQTALLFGPERTGLENDDIVQCDAILTIPLSDRYPSLNLAQAVAICCYEWHQDATEIPAYQEIYGTAPPADKAMLEGLFLQLEHALDRINFFQVPDKKPKMIHNLRNLFQRAKLSEQEVRTLRGIVKGLDKDTPSS